MIFVASLSEEVQVYTSSVRTFGVADAPAELGRTRPSVRKIR